MKYVLGIDFGGGSSKALLLSESGEIAAEASVEYPTYFPENGFCEQRPADWYDAACENIRILLEKSGVSSSDIKAMALDAATHTAVLCDENFNVLRDSVYWTDTRSFAECKFLRENTVILFCGNVITARTQSGLCRSFCGLKTMSRSFSQRFGKLCLQKTMCATC